jgi:hypothetical protein
METLRSRVETLCFIVIAVFCLVAVGLLAVISLSAVSDVLGGP